MGSEAWDDAGLLPVLSSIVVGLVLVSFMAGVAGAEAGQDLSFSKMKLEPIYMTCPQGCHCLTDAEVKALFGNNYEMCSDSPCGESISGSGDSKFCFKAKQQSYIAPPASTGSLSLSSQPSGASVILDGVNQGITPVTVSGLSSGYHTARFSLAGYQEQTETVTVLAGQTSSYTFGLSPLVQAPRAATTGGLGLNTIPSGATVVVDSVNRGTTPVTVTGLSSGHHTAWFSLAGYQEQTETVTVTAGQNVGYTFALSPERGSGGGTQGSDSNQVGVVPISDQVGTVQLPDDQQGAPSVQSVKSVDQLDKLNLQPEPLKSADSDNLNPLPESPKLESRGFFDPILGFFLNLLGGKSQEKPSITKSNPPIEMPMGEYAFETFYIKSIQPVQVINDNVPLVKGKGTVFRVVVCSTYSTDQFAELKLTLPADQWSMNVQRYGLPSPIIQGPFRISANTSIEIILPDIPLSKRYLYANPRIDNFEDIDNIGKILRGDDGTGPDRRVSPDIRIMPAPFLSSNDKEVSYSVEIDPGMKIPGSHAANGVPTKSGTASLVRTKSWQMLFMIQKCDNTSLDAAQILPGIKENLNEVLAIFPIADTQLYGKLADDIGTAPCYIGQFTDACEDAAGNLKHGVFIGCNPHMPGNKCPQCEAAHQGESRQCGYSYDLDRRITPDLSIYCQPDPMTQKYTCSQDAINKMSGNYNEWKVYEDLKAAAEQQGFNVGVGMRITAGQTTPNMSIQFNPQPPIRHWLLAHEFGHFVGLGDTYGVSQNVTFDSGRFGKWDIWTTRCKQGPLTGFWVNNYQDITKSVDARHFMNGPSGNNWIVNTSLRQFHTGNSECVYWMERENDEGFPDKANDGYKKLLEIMKAR